MDQEHVAYNFEQYNLFSAGVVDKNNHLIGMITGDDIVTVIKEEAEEDTFRLAGVSDEEISDSAFGITKKDLFGFQLICLQHCWPLLSSVFLMQVLKKWWL